MHKFPIMQVLSNWLARQTVNLFPSGLGGSSPPTCTNRSKASKVMRPA